MSFSLQRTSLYGAVFFLALIAGIFHSTRSWAAIDGLTPATAFTDIGMARNVTSAGVYHFNVNGTAFSTHVNASGQLLIGVDFGNGFGALPSVANLTTAARGMLNTTVLALLASITEIRLISTTGNIDATTTNPTLLARVAANSPLNRGKIDNAYQNDWTGVGANRLTNVRAYCNTSLGTTLNTVVIHTCGDGYRLNWIPRFGYQREVFFGGEIHSTASFQLYVGAASVPVPVAASLSITKTADITTNVTVGQLITYTYVITNDGGAVINNVKLNDVHDGLGPPPIPNADTAILTDNAPSGDSNNSSTGDGVWDVLGPGDVLTVTAPYTITQSDIDQFQ